VASVTKEPAWYFNMHDGKVYGDTIGLSDPDVSDLEIAQGIKGFMKTFNHGVHCIIIVAKFGRFTKEERGNLKMISTLFDKRWVRSSIMVLTHYEGDTDEESQQNAIHNWLGEDKEINEFASMIGKRIILADNSLGRHEALNRPFRQQCLSKLNMFIDSCDIVVGPAPTDFIGVLKVILEYYFAGYASSNAAGRVDNVVRYLQSITVETGTCSICLEDMKLSNMAKTECHHIFHLDCVIKAVKNKRDACPVCRQPVNEICIMYSYLNNVRNL
jgi:hypothetical protein